ncbi:Shufflon-specific DNA recombinase [Candidatus Paraburkholderia calva]|nr:Shufflon-specific DNA recombinase [Candidatus Paraburkholderia calva]
MNLLHHVLEHARKEWGIGTIVNPVSEVRRPKNPPSRDRILTDVEKAHLLLMAGKNPRSRYLPEVLELAWETGMRMRQGEIVPLEIERVDLEGYVVSLKEGTTKNDAARTVPLSSRAVAILKKAIGGRTKGRVAESDDGGGKTRAFIRLREKSGDRMSPFVTRVMRRRLTSWSLGCLIQRSCPSPDTRPPR